MDIGSDDTGPLFSNLCETLEWLKALYKEDYPHHHGQTPMINQVLAQAQLCLKEF